MFDYIFPSLTVSADTGVEEVKELIPDAIVNKDVEDVITFLLNHGADINATDDYRQTPLNYAAVKGNIEAISLLLKSPDVNKEVCVF